MEPNGFTETSAKAVSVSETALDLHFESDPIRVRQAVRDILSYLEEHLPGQSQEERWEFKLIFNELLYNAVIHGNASDTAKRVRVRLSVDGGCVNASITDEGSGYDYQQIVDMARRNEMLDCQRESGRGLRLVLALTDHIEFNSGGSSVTFHKKVKPHHG